MGVRVSAYWAALLLLSSLTAGCLGGEPTEADEQETPVVDPGPTMGTLIGMVTDVDLLPLENVTVAIVETADKTATDAAGAFRFGSLEPGTYSVVFNLLGYREEAKQATAEVGKTTEMTVAMTRLVVAPEPWLDIYPMTAFIQVGQAFVDNRIPLEYHPCDSCDHFVPIVVDPSDGLFEVTFTNGISSDMDDIWFQINRNWTNATGSTAMTDGEALTSGYLQDRERAMLTEGMLERMYEHEVEELWIHLASGAFVPSLNKRIDGWLTLAYHRDLGLDFSSLPPE